MKRYIEHVQSRDPHDRRVHAMRLAGTVTAAVFAVWITTLGFRLSAEAPHVAAEDQSSLSASAAQSLYNSPNTLIVATSTSF